jgi:OOP family OmpA-OmpF porin
MLPVSPRLVVRFALALLALVAAPARVAAQLPARPTFTIVANELVLPAPIPFTAGEATLAPGHEAALAHVKAYLDDKAYITMMRIEAHVAPMGDPAREQALADARALAVVRALVALGVDCKRLLPVGFGASKPVAANTTPEGRAQNARIVAVNAMLRGRAIGGMPVDGGGRVAGDACQ